MKHRAASLRQQSYLYARCLSAPLQRVVIVKCRVGGRPPTEYIQSATLITKRQQRNCFRRRSDRTQRVNIIYRCELEQCAKRRAMVSGDFEAPVGKHAALLSASFDESTRTDRPRSAAQSTTHEQRVNGACSAGRPRRPRLMITRRGHLIGRRHQ